MRDFKAFTGKEPVKLIAANPRESRKEWMMRVFRAHDAAIQHNKGHRFRQQSNRPISLDKPEPFEQTLRYLLEYPLRAGLANDATAYQWSSANPLLSCECDVA